MKKLLMFAAMTLVALPAIAGAAEKQSIKSETRGGKPYFEASETITKQGTVLSVDKTTRHLKLRGESGDTLKVKAGERVKNFAQIKKGDTVKLTYTERLTIHIEAAGTAEMTEETSTEAAKPGAMPKGRVTERMQYKATITGIDKAKGTATLKGYDGEEFEVTPLKPENLDKVSVGEMVVFTHTTAIAGSVERLPANK